MAKQTTLFGDDPYKPLDLLMCVGKNYTEESFGAEGKRLGVCKRIPKGAPLDIQVGHREGVPPSRCFLAHDLNEENKAEYENWKKKQRVWLKAKKKAKDDGLEFSTPEPKKPELTLRIFAYFPIKGVLVVGNTADILKKEGLNIDESVIQEVSPENAMTMQKRGCGFLIVGGVYIVSDEAMEALQKHADSIEGTFYNIDPPIPTTLKRYRGIKYCRGDRILNHDPQETWFDVEGVRKENKKVRKLLGVE